MQTFWHLLNQLQHTPGLYEAWRGAETDGPKVVVYGGSALQAFLTALAGHGQVFWGQITG
jgi:hypothetical protein